MKHLVLILILFLFIGSLGLQANDRKIAVGAERIQEYLPLLKGKKIGLVANHTSVVGRTHLVDTLLSLGVNVQKIFCPEHGFRGKTEAGALIENTKDPKTNLPIISLYGKNKKPKKVDFEDLDIVIFDIQDVGARFYTYISTLHYVMETAAETKKPVLILDRPNPNGFYIDGPVLDTNLRSFVGMHAIPIVYGLTIGEYAQMINGEKWLQSQMQCQLMIVTVENYSHHILYELPIAPSPNLQKMNAIYLYPSLCWFEGTPVSIGRGTAMPFEVLGFPTYKDRTFSFIPTSIIGVSENPPLKNSVCYGLNLEEKGKEILQKKQLNLSYLIEIYKAFPEKEFFFQGFFDKLSGTKELKTQIIKGMNEQEIRQSWQKGLQEYKIKRQKYLLYEDFE